MAKASEAGKNRVGTTETNHEYCVLKIDRTFVNDIESDENGAAICAATIALAHNLGLEVVAGGVETEVQRQFLSEHKSDYLQGYLFSRPLSAAKATAFLMGHD